MKKIFIALFALSFSFSIFAAPVNVNTADAKTISDSLSGIGMKKAEAIVKYRTEHGPFKTADDLVNVSGIGAKTVAKIKKDVLLGDDGAAPASPTSAAPPVAKAEEPKAEKK